MSWRTKTMAMVGLSLAFTLSSGEAEAQRIRTFGDSDSSGTTVTYPGQPQPAPVQEAAPAAEAQPAESAETSTTSAGVEQVGSYQIGLYGADKRRSAPEEQSQVFLRNPEELYQGIIPGVRDALPHLASSRQLRGSSTPLTWVGFQAEEQRTRIFFQSPRPLTYQVRKAQDGQDLVLIFENTRIPERNFSRFIDATYFERAVRRIEASEKRGGIVEVRLTMNERAEPKISTEGEYLYLDFAHQAASAE